MLFRSDIFKRHADEACILAKKFDGVSFGQIKELLSSFFHTTDYSARAFEVTIHGFYQAMDELSFLGDIDVAPMSQMRSANKKHGMLG